MDNISLSDNDDNLLYENGTFITCRNAFDSFYLCQVLQNVYTDTKTINIRWCSPVDENGDDTKINTKTKFKFVYKDKLDPNTILMNIPDIIYHKNDDTVSLKKQHIVDTKRLLEKSIRDKSLSSDDMMDLSTEHQCTSSKKKQPAHIHFPSSGENDSSSSSESPVQISSKSIKRKKVLDKKKSRKQPAKKRQRTKDISELSDNENEPVKPKKKRIYFNRNNSN